MDEFTLVLLVAFGYVLGRCAFNLIVMAAAFLYVRLVKKKGRNKEEDPFELFTGEEVESGGEADLDGVEDDVPWLKEEEEKGRKEMPARGFYY